MGDVVELNRKTCGFTVDEVLGLAQREEFDEVVVIGRRGGGGVSVWVSDMESDRAHWLASKAKAALLEIG